MANWYVDTALGTDDVSHGTGEGTDAFKTLQYAADFASLASGDTIKVAAGTYTEDVDVNDEITEEAASLSTIVDGGFRAFVDNVTVELFTIMNGRAGPTAYYPACVASDDGENDDLVVKSCVIVGAGSDLPKTGLYFKISDGVLLLNNTIYGGISRAIAFITTSHNMTVLNNNIYECMGGICPGESDDADIMLNDIYNNTGEGMQNWKSDRLKINLNNIYGNALGIGYHTCVDLDVRYNWWGATDGPGGDEPGSGDKLQCDNAPTTDPDPYLIAPVAHTFDSTRNTLMGVGKFTGGGAFNIRSLDDDYNSGLVLATRSRLKAASGLIGESFQGTDEHGVAITCMAMGNPTTGRYRSVLRTATEKYIVDV